MRGYKSFNKDRADKLLDSLLLDPTSPLAGVWMNDLLGEFHRGYPLENLRLLLLNRNSDAAAVGAWIASELGSMGESLLDDVSRLIVHPNATVRFSVIDCVLLWADASKGKALAAVASLITDSDAGVRWKAMDFLSRAAPDQLSAALLQVQLHDPYSSTAKGLKLLLCQNGEAGELAIAALRSNDSVFRKYGAILARRSVGFNNAALSYAASVNDPDIRRFVRSGSE